MTKDEAIAKIINDKLGIDYPTSKVTAALSLAYDEGAIAAALANLGTPAVQDQPTQKGLLSELIGIREGMATKADLVKLEEGLTTVLCAIDSNMKMYLDNLIEERSATRPDPTASADWDPLRFDLLLQRIDCLENTTVARLTERVDRLSNWYHELICGLKDHGSRIQDLERSATRPEQIVSVELASGMRIKGPFATVTDNAGTRIVGGRIESVPPRTPERPAQDSTKNNPDDFSDYKL